MFLNCGFGEDSWEPLGLQGDPIHSEGEQPWDFIGRNDAKAEAPVLWPPYVKSWLIGKDCDAGRDWGQEEKGTTEDEMDGWHHGLDGRESEWTPGDGDGQGGLEWCNSWGRKESDTTEWLKWTELNWTETWQGPERKLWQWQMERERSTQKGSNWQNLMIVVKRRWRAIFLFFADFLDLRFST